MTICYSSKKAIWVKVAFILDRFGGQEKELSKSCIVDIMGSLFPKQSVCTTGLGSRIRLQIKSQIFDEVQYTTKNKTIRLKDHSIIEEHSSVMERWDQKTENKM
jgi:hypothetical protein